MVLNKYKYNVVTEKMEDGSYKMELRAKSGGRFFSFPVSTTLKLNHEEITTLFDELYIFEDTYVFTKKMTEGPISEAILKVIFNDDDIEYHFSMTARETVSIDAIELFRKGRFGLYMVDCIKYFTPQPRNYNGINRAFNRSFCDCSSDGYFSPAPLNFTIGNANGWISFGLLELPDSDGFYLTPNLGVMISEPYGHISFSAAEEYKAPGLMITFPDDEWQGETVFRNKLISKGCMKDTSELIKSFPDWWKKPTVCTYGDQMLDLQYNWYTDYDWASPEFNQKWLEKWILDAENALGFNDFTIIIDAFWQDVWSADPEACKERFPDLRGFIDRCHAKGHKVLLWYSPFTDSIDNGYEPLSKKYGVLTGKCAAGLSRNRYYIDFTNDNAESYLNEVARKLFGNEPDCLNCDGLKMDFLASFIPCRNGEFQHPEKGIGMKGYYNFYKLFDKTARRVKEDVFLDGSACDPRIEEVLHINRLHDIQNVYEERELRARVSAMASPGIIIDSDGAIMLSSWVKETYLNACIYGTPSLYYIKKFHDGISLTGETMLALGRLLSLSSIKKYAHPEFVSPGNWKLWDGDELVGQTIDGKTVIIYDKDDIHMHIFSWENGQHEIKIEGRKPCSLPDDVSLNGDILNVNLKDNEILTLSLK